MYTLFAGTLQQHHQGPQFTSYGHGSEQKWAVVFSHVYIIQALMGSGYASGTVGSIRVLHMNVSVDVIN